MVSAHSGDSELELVKDRVTDQTFVSIFSQIARVLPIKGVARRTRRPDSQQVSSGAGSFSLGQRELLEEKRRRSQAQMHLSAVVSSICCWSEGASQTGVLPPSQGQQVRKEAVVFGCVENSSS